MIIYSRFNVRHFCIERLTIPGYNPGDRPIRRMNKVRFDDGWLARRLELFRSFTYPSVCAQTDQNFRWLGLVHVDSPSWFIEALREFDRMEVRLVEWDIDAAVRGTPSVNLDTDDAISRDFIETVKAVDHSGAITFDRGMRHRLLTGNWVTGRTPTSHFNTVKHPTKTVLDFNHGQQVLDPMVVDSRRPMWLEVVHEENIANKMVTSRRTKDLGRGFAERYFELGPELDWFKDGMAPWVNYGRGLSDT